MGEKVKVNKNANPLGRGAVTTAPTRRRVLVITAAGKRRWTWEPV